MDSAAIADEATYLDLIILRINRTLVISLVITDKVFGFRSDIWCNILPCHMLSTL